MKIFKYRLNIADRQDVTLPRGAIVLSVGDQNGELQLWAMVEPEAPLEPRRFFVCGTGLSAPGPGRGRFIGTVQQDIFVWHVFEEVRYGQA